MYNNCDTNGVMKKLIAVRFKQPDLDVLKEIASMQGETVSETIRDVIEEYVQKRLKEEQRFRPGLRRFTKVWQESVSKSRKEGKKS